MFAPNARDHDPLMTMELHPPMHTRVAALARLEAGVAATPPVS